MSDFITEEPLKTAAKAKIEELRLKSESIYGRSFPVPKITFDLTGTTAGKAWGAKNLIKLNWILLRENKQNFIDRTPGHEWVHVVVYHVFGPGLKPHGKEFKEVARSLGVPETRCHSYDVTRSKKGAQAKIVKQIGQRCNFMNF